MGDRRMERGVKRYLMVRKGFEHSEGKKFAHGTGGLGFLGIWRDLAVQERDYDQKVYAYLALDLVLEQWYTWFEHFGEGLWARFAILVQGPFRSEPGEAHPPMQYRCSIITRAG